MSSTYKKSSYAEFCKSSGAQDHCLKEILFFWNDVLDVREHYNFIPFLSSPHVILNTKINTRFVILKWTNGAWQVTAGDNDPMNEVVQHFNNISHHSMISNPQTLKWICEMLMLDNVSDETIKYSRVLLDKFLNEDERSVNWAEHHYRKVTEKIENFTVL